MNTIAIFIKQKRKEAGITQEEFAIRSGLGLRFVRELEQDKEQLALTLNGKKQNIRRKDFLVFAEACGLNRKSAEKMIKRSSRSMICISACAENHI